MKIKTVQGTITKIVDLSKTAKDVTITLSETLDFIAGNFVNLMMDVDGVKTRRAFSISSSDNEQHTISLSIRESLKGTLSPLFWKQDMTGTVVDIMGPMGVHTADTLQANKIYLFAYGVGTGVVKSVLDHCLRSSTATHILVMTGSRSEDEILHKAYFDEMATQDKRLEVRHIISEAGEHSSYKIGYIQDHLEGIDFNNADVYACGQKRACDGLLEVITAQHPVNCRFSIESFG